MRGDHEGCAKPQTTNGNSEEMFGNGETDARHWNPYLDEIFQNPACAEVLSALFHAE